MSYCKWPFIITLSSYRRTIFDHLVHLKVLMVREQSRVSSYQGEAAVCHSLLPVYLHSCSFFFFFLRQFLCFHHPLSAVPSHNSLSLFCHLHTLSVSPHCSRTFSSLHSFPPFHHRSRLSPILPPHDFRTPLSSPHHFIPDPLCPALSTDIPQFVHLYRPHSLLFTITLRIYFISTSRRCRLSTRDP